jgi:RsiW-degrading membrane proteinase PrsW (M82 family)
MPPTSQSLVSQSLQAAKQITAANRQPGYEKNVHRIQGFVFGALFVTAINLVGELLFKHQPQVAKELATAWATSIFAAFVYAWIVASIDRNEKEPWHMLLVGLLWGSMVSAAIAGLLNSIADRFIHVAAHKVSPFTEELTKGAVLLLIFRYAEDEFDDALDGLVYGAMVGIGFAMAENASYFFNFEPARDISDQINTFQFLLRGILQGLAGHATYTALIGLGLGLSRQTQRRGLKIVLPMLGIAGAIFAHALWNNDAVQNFFDRFFSQHRAWAAGPTATRVALINGPFFIGVVIAIIFSWRKEAHVIALQLIDELNPNDPYTAPAMMLTFKSRLQARWKILWSSGIIAWWTLRQLQHAYIDLAFCKWRGKDESEVRQRIGKLRTRLAL